MVGALPFFLAAPCLGHFSRPRVGLEAGVSPLTAGVEGSCFAVAACCAVLLLLFSLCLVVLSRRLGGTAALC